MILLKKILADMLGSKKVLAVMAGGISSIVARVGLAPYIGAEDAQQLAAYLIALAGAYVIGQGVADAGKEKAKIEASAPQA